MKAMQYVLGSTILFLTSCSAILGAVGLAPNPDPFEVTSSSLAYALGDGSASGWVDASGKPIAEVFQVATDNPLAMIECRSARADVVDTAVFSAANCDVSKLGQGLVEVPIKRPTNFALIPSGFFAAEVRVSLENEVLAQSKHQRYIHLDLSRVKACANKNSDAQILSYARQFITKNGKFGDGSQLSNPYIAIEWADKTLSSANSLRRVFRLSNDKDFLLIRRDLASKKSAGSSCNPGVSIAGFEGRAIEYVTPISHKNSVKHNIFHVACNAVVANAAGDGVCVSENSLGALKAEKIFTGGALKRRLRSRATHSPWSPKLSAAGKSLGGIPSGANHLATVLSD